MLISVVVGTRPEIIKMAPVYFALKKAKLLPRLVHSGQHYDHKMSKVFLEELGLPEPDSFLSVGSGSPGQQTGDAIIKFEKEFTEPKPDCVLVEGDTNTVLAAAIGAMKKHVKVGHVEAGLRSYDLRMPEELNRRLTDHIHICRNPPNNRAASRCVNRSSLQPKYASSNRIIRVSCNHCVRFISLPPR